jgi:hypothetical protein
VRGDGVPDHVENVILGTESGDFVGDFIGLFKFVELAVGLHHVAEDVEVVLGALETLS